MSGIKPKNKYVQRIAKRLAADWGNNSIEVSDDGFRVPVWLLFVSEAQKIWDNHCNANDIKPE